MDLWITHNLDNGTRLAEKNKSRILSGVEGHLCLQLATGTRPTSEYTHDSPHVEGMEAIDVLVRVQLLHDRTLVQVAWQRQLHQHPVNMRQPAHPPDLALQGRLLYVLRQREDVNVDASAQAGLLLTRHVEQ